MKRSGAQYLEPWELQAFGGVSVSLNWPMFGNLSTPEGFTRACMLAQDYIARNGGRGSIFIPAGTYSHASSTLIRRWIFTVTIASPAVVTKSSHGLVDGDKWIPSLTSGALPTGLTLGVTYYVKRVDANTFQIAATPGGASINTSGSQSGTHTSNSPIASADNGYGVLMEAQHSNITWCGAGMDATVIEPVSNTVEMFVQFGATNIAFRHITFNNRANGVRQNQAKASKYPGTGSAMGNAANCAIRQYFGANLDVQFCEFLEFHTCDNYNANYLDDQELVGRSIFSNNRCDGCVFGHLNTQPKYSITNGNEWLNGIDSHLSTGARDPGHLVYIANTAGAAPLDVQANDNYADGHTSSVLKLRKGWTQNCVGNNFYNVHRGIESHNARTVCIMGGTIKLAMRAVNSSGAYTDMNQSAIEVTGCYGTGLVEGVVIDRSGTYGHAVRVRPADVAEDDEGEAADGELPRNLTIRNIEIVDDLSLYTGPPTNYVFRPWVLVRKATDCTFENISLRIIGNVANTNYVLDADNCTRIETENIRRFADAASNPSGSDRLVRIASGCTDCTVKWERGDLGKGQAPTSDTIVAAGTNTTVIRTDGLIRGTWTPAPTFVTRGNFDPANVVAAGWYEKRADSLLVGCKLKFDTNAWTTAADGFRITGLPFTANTYGQPFRAAVAIHQFLSLSGADVGVSIDNTDNFFTLRRNAQNGAGSALDVTNFPASTAGFDIEFQIVIRINET